MSERLSKIQHYDTGSFDDIASQTKGITRTDSRKTLSEGEVSSLAKKVFNSIDQDGSGSIDAVEMRRLLKQWGLTGVDHNSLVETFMRVKPSSKKYSLNLLEFNDFMNYFFGIKNQFDSYPKDNPDNIKLGELPKFLLKFNYTFAPEILGKFLDLFDADKSGTLEFNEIFNLVLYLNRLEFYYAQEDSNGDHSLDHAELQSLLRALKIHVTAEETKLMMETLPPGLTGDLNFTNFVDLFFYVKENLPQIKAKAAVSRANNKRQPFKRSKPDESSWSKKKIKEAVDRIKPVVERAVSECKRSGRKWEDPDFPPTMNSLFPSDTSRAAGIGKWLRPEQLGPKPSLFVDGVDEGDVIQGALGDCYLLSAFCVLATCGNNTIQDLFVGSYPEAGIYQVRFFKNGEWHVVTVDDRVPTNKMGAVHFSMCRDKNEFWVQLLEKAYAKLHGSYEAIEHGVISDALVDITGEPSEIFHELEDADELWNKMFEYMQSGYLLGCTAEVEEVQQTLQPSAMGILVNHAYGILDVQEYDGHRLLRLRNPWGSYEWTGPWSDGSCEWTPEILEYFNFEFGDDGTFFMEFHDWVEHFTRAVVVRIMGDKWEKARFAGEWKKPDTCGGCVNHPTWAKNPQLKLVSPTTRKVFVSLMHECSRFKFHKHIPYPSLGTTAILRKESGNTKQEHLHSRKDIAAVSQFIKTRESSLAFTAEAGQEYTLVLSTYDPLVEGKWYSTVCSLGGAVQVIELTDRKPSTTVKGEWIRDSAAGCIDWNSWRNGKQFHLRVDQGGPKIITIVQSRKEPASNMAHIGFVIFPAEEHQLPTVDKTNVVHQAKYLNSATVSETVDLKPGLYNILPCTFRPFFENKWGLAVQGGGCTLSEIPQQWEKSETFGQWTSDLSGGCHNNNNRDYMKNPMVFFTLGSNASCNFILQVDQDSQISGIGFYLFEAENKTLTKRIDRSDFKTEKEVFKKWDLQPGRYGVLVTTYNKGVTGGWRLHCFSTEMINFEK